MIKKTLEKYNETWDKIKSLFGKTFGSKPVYNGKQIEPKTNSCNTNFYGNITAIDGEYYTFFSVILLYSIVNVEKKNHPQIFSNECKYAIKLMNDKNQMILMMINMMINLFFL